MASLRKSLLLLALSACFYGCGAHVVAVSIKNNTGAAMRNVEVTFNGGSYGVATLAAGNTFRNRVKIFGTGALEIHYDDASGKSHSLTGPKLNRNDEGTVEVTVSETGSEWSGATKPR